MQLANYHMKLVNQINNMIRISKINLSCWTNEFKINENDLLIFTNKMIAYIKY